MSEAENLGKLRAAIDELRAVVTLAMEMRAAQARYFGFAVGGARFDAVEKRAALSKAKRLEMEFDSRAGYALRWTDWKE